MDYTPRPFYRISLYRLPARYRSRICIGFCLLLRLMLRVSKAVSQWMRFLFLFLLLEADLWRLSQKTSGMVLRLGVLRLLVRLLPMVWILRRQVILLLDCMFFIFSYILHTLVEEIDSADRFLAAWPSPYLALLWSLWSCLWIPRLTVFLLMLLPRSRMGLSRRELMYNLAGYNDLGLLWEFDLVTGLTRYQVYLTDANSWQTSAFHLFGQQVRGDVVSFCFIPYKLYLWAPVK